MHVRIEIAHVLLLLSYYSMIVLLMLRSEARKRMNDKTGVVVAFFAAVQRHVRFVKRLSP